MVIINTNMSAAYKCDPKSGASISSRVASSMKWINVIPKNQFFGTYTQSTLDAINISSFKPSSVRIRVEGLSDGTVELIVQESLRNEDPSYVNSSTPSLIFTQITTGEVVTLNQTKLQKMNLVGNWMRFKLNIALNSSSIRAVSIQVDVSSN